MILAQAKRSRHIITAGLTSIDASNVQVGQQVVVVLNRSWEEFGKTYTAEVTNVNHRNAMVRVKFTSDVLPGRNDHVNINLASPHRSKLFLLEQPVTHAAKPAEPEKTLFQLMSEYDIKRSLLLRAQRDTEHAKAEFDEARVALAAALAKDRHL